MAKYVLIAEEGERGLIAQASERFGLDVTDAEVVVTGVGSINIIRSLQG